MRVMWPPLTQDSGVCKEQVSIDMSIWNVICYSYLAFDNGVNLVAKTK